MKLNSRGSACGLLAGVCLRNLRKTNSLNQGDGSLSPLDYKVECTSVAAVIQDCIIIIINVVVAVVVVVVVVAVLVVVVVVVAIVVVVWWWWWWWWWWWR